MPADAVDQICLHLYRDSNLEFAMKKAILFLMIFGISSVASAKGLPTFQWKTISGVTLHGLVSNGFHIVGITEDNIAKNEGGNTYYLQKANRVFRCSEDYLIDMKHKNTVSVFMCQELVEPFTPTK